MGGRGKFTPWGYHSGTQRLGQASARNMPDKKATTEAHHDPQDSKDHRRAVGDQLGVNVNGHMAYRLLQKQTGPPRNIHT